MWAAFSIAAKAFFGRAWTGTVAAAKQLTLRQIGLGLWAALTIYLFVALFGFNVAFVHIEGAKHRAERFENDYKTLKSASDQAAKKQHAQDKRVEQNTSHLAKGIDRAESQDLPKQLSVLDRYVAAHRVRPQADRGAPGQSVDAAQDRGAQSADGPGAAPNLDAGPITDDADPWVLARKSDLTICTINTSRLDKAHNWAIDLNATIQAARDPSAEDDSAAVANPSPEPNTGQGNATANDHGNDKHSNSP